MASTIFRVLVICMTTPHDCMTIIRMNLPHELSFHAGVVMNNSKGVGYNKHIVGCVCPHAYLYFLFVKGVLVSECCLCSLHQ